ncbi:MAG: response regulator transcription factor [Actinomycetia bacterium]|nr:response regulator transcription factor [Actinomycetes bacterium]
MKVIIPKDSLVVGDMILNLEKYELSVNGEIVALTFKEFEILKLLLQNKNKVFTRINLLSAVWGYDYYGGSRTVDVHMRRLRVKIPPPYNNMLKTIRNVGYMFSPQK